jgi:hypothetical protein
LQKLIKPNLRVAKNYPAESIKAEIAEIRSFKKQETIFHDRRHETACVKEVGK